MTTVLIVSGTTRCLVLHDIERAGAGIHLQSYPGGYFYDKFVHRFIDPNK